MISGKMRVAVAIVSFFTVVTSLSAASLAAPFTFSDGFSPVASPDWSNSTGDWLATSGAYAAQKPNNNPPAFTQLPYQFTNSGLVVTVKVNALADAGIVFGEPGSNNLILVLGGYGYGQGTRGNGAGTQAYFHLNALNLTGPVNGPAYALVQGVFTPGLTYTFTVTDSNGLFTLYNDIDGIFDANSKVITSYTDSALTSIKVGLYDDQPNTTTGSGSGTPTTFSNFSVTGNLVAAVPEPSGIALLSTGLLAFGLSRRNRA